MRLSRIIIALLALTMLGQPSIAEEAKTTDEVTFSEAFKDAKIKLALRYRFEDVSQDGIDKGATASTLRTALRYETLTWKRLRAALELENVVDIGTDDRYNNVGAGDLHNGVTDRPVIADPEITDVNQAYLGIALPGATDLELGRWELALADQRFVGPVGWRQNHQSFDGGLLTSRAGGDLALTFGYISNVNQITGGNKNMSSPILDVGWNLGFGTIAGYAYLLDYSRPPDAGLSTSTYGLRFDGKHALGEGAAITYHFQLAQQDDAGDNPSTIDADYLRLELGGKLSGFSGGIGYESLSGSPRNGKFTTPLATLHKWNGWADKFLATPTNGLVDVWLVLGWAGNGFTVKAIYHDFQSESGSFDWGTELDFLVSFKSSWKQVFALKGALYGADAHATDTDKIWLFTQYTF